VEKGPKTEDGRPKVAAFHALNTLEFSPFHGFRCAASIAVEMTGLSLVLIVVYAVFFKIMLGLFQPPAQLPAGCFTKIMSIK
jgi:hypothetical protein